jgi:hypothetical protein
MYCATVKQYFHSSYFAKLIKGIYSHVVDNSKNTRKAGKETGSEK